MDDMVSVKWKQNIDKYVDFSVLLDAIRTIV